MAVGPVWCVRFVAPEKAHGQQNAHTIPAPPHMLFVTCSGCSASLRAASVSVASGFPALFSFLGVPVSASALPLVGFAGGRWRTMSRLLNFGIVPLLVLFFVTVATRVADVMR